MATTTKIGFEEFRKFQEAADETVRYELDEGELILTPSATPRHHLVALRLWRALAVWLVYPALQLVEIHDGAGIRQVTAPEPLIEERLFPEIQFSLSLTELFDDDPEQ